MKKLLLILLLLSSSLLAIKGQGTWTSRSPLPPPDSAMFQGIPGFSINGYGYAGLGEYNHSLNEFDELWQFDPSKNSWTKKASFPGKARVAPACFVIGNYAYLVCGSVKNGGACVNECWQYDATTNKWTQKANFPGGARTYAIGFAIDSLGYVGTGADELKDFYKDFYAYHPSTNTWTKIADFGGIARDGDCGFAVSGKGYVCFGQDSLFSGHWLNNDMWEYDPGTNTWTQKSSYPGPLIYATSGFAICSNIYVGSGEDTNGFSNEFWKYNTTLDTWTQEVSVPGFTKIEGAAFAIADTGYYGFGADSDVVIQNDFYRFYAGDSCDVNTGYTTIHDVSEISIYPNPTNQKLNIELNSQIMGLATLSIMDITGRVVLSCAKNISYDITQVDVSSLPPAMYFISIKSKDIIITQKFIKN